jgi:hypothetical protein
MLDFRRRNRDAGARGMAAVIGKAGRWRWILLALAALAGCAATADRGRVEQFDKIAKAYETAIRWSDFQRAAGVAGIGAAQTEALPKLSRVRVLSYDPVSAEISPDTLRVQQTVQIEFMLEGSMKLRRIVDRQGWRFDDVQGRWVLVSGLPDFLGE